MISHPSETIFRGITRVPAAHLATFTSTSPVARLTQYWDIDPSREIRYTDSREYSEHLRSLYVEALRARLRGVDRAAILLSGGVDSSSVVGIVSTLGSASAPIDVRAYTHALRGFPDADEEQYAERVARFCGVPMVAIPFEGADVHHHREAAAGLEDTSPGMLGRSDFTLANRITFDGCRVVLSGIGGDEWFTGSARHSVDLIRRGHVVAGLRQLWADGHHPDAHSIRVLGRTCAWALLPAPVRRAIKAVRRAPDLVPPGVSREFAAEVSLVDRIRPRALDPRFPTLAAAATYAAAMHPHGIYAWEESARQASIFGHELSAPLLDRRIAEFAMALPEEQRWSGTETKRVLRAAVSGLLPDDIRLRRQKSDPGAVIFGEVERAVVQNGFQDMGLVHAGIIDAAAVGSMYRDMIRLFAEGEPHYKFLAYRLWTIFVGECVWRTSFDQSIRPPVECSPAIHGGFSGAATSRARVG